ncbi:hypothetical protein NHQ30_004849 [Ciborinia camelliae]|nr:hypothetical protein NHQ30_004849 [Ciborinia camelliae]
MSKYNPSSDIPDLTGRIVLITGGHSGLGLATTQHLARHHATVYIAARPSSKHVALAFIQDIKKEHRDAVVHHLEVDLGDLESVRKGVKVFLSRENELHILINNAGIMCTPYTLSPQGHELQFQTNHLSHFLLTQLLLPTLIATATNYPPNTVRVINIASDAHSKIAPKSGINFYNLNLPDASTWARYGQSKLANVLFAKELARRHPRILALSCHPGTVKTKLSQGPLSSSAWYKFVKPLVELGAPEADKGCFSILHLATSVEVKEENNGGYFLPVGREVRASKWGEDEEMARRLWEVSMMMLGLDIGELEGIEEV